MDAYGPDSCHPDAPVAPKDCAAVVGAHRVSLALAEAARGVFGPLCHPDAAIGALAAFALLCARHDPPARAEDDNVAAPLMVLRMAPRFRRACAHCLPLDAAPPVAARHHAVPHVSPLSFAAAMGHADCVRGLLAMGADPHVADADGASPLTVAETWGHDACAALLRGHP